MNYTSAHSQNIFQLIPGATHPWLQSAMMYYMLISWVPFLWLQMKFDIDPGWPESLGGKIIRFSWMASMFFAAAIFLEEV